MMKTINKFLSVVFLGVFILAPIDSHAKEKKLEAHDAWEVLKEKVDPNDQAFKDFSEKFVKSAEENIVVCGARSCSLNTHVCMQKQDGNSLEYKCVLKGEITLHEAQNYVKYNSDQNKESTKITDACYTAKNNSGNVGQYCIKVIGNTIEVRTMVGGKVGCEVIPAAWFSNSKCRFCSLIGGIFSAADKMAAIAQDAFAYSFAVVIALGLLIWVAIKTVSFVSSMTKQDAAKYITEMIKQSYKFMIAFFILSNYSASFDYIIRPILRTGLEFGQGFVNIKGDYNLEENIRNRFKNYKITKISDLVDKKNENDFPSDYYKNIDNKFFDFETYVKMENFAYSVNRAYSFMQTVGSGLFCLGTQYIMGRAGGGLEIGLGLSCMIYGGILAAFGFLLCIAFMFYLIDAVVQLGVVGGLLPFLIASWPFKITSKYTSTGFKMFLNSVFTFMMMGLVVKVSLLLVSNSIAVGAGNSEEEGFLFLAEAIDTVNTDTIRQSVSVFSIAFCIFIFANIMCFLMLSKVSEFTNKFASGGMKGSAPSIATMAASSVKGGISKVASPTMKAVNKRIDKAGGYLADKTVGLVTLRPLRRAYTKRGNSKKTSGARPDGASIGSSNVNSSKQATIGSSK